MPNDQDLELMRLIGLNHAKKYAELRAKLSQREIKIRKINIL